MDGGDDECKEPLFALDIDWANIKPSPSSWPVAEHPSRHEKNTQQQQQQSSDKGTGFDDGHLLVCGNGGVK